MKNTKEYAIYKGDTFLDIGTLDELCVKFNKKRKNLQWIANARRGKEKEHKWGYVLVPVEEDEDE